ncbi:hypothetical protein CLAFUW4_08376 [Fulvia fulva]|uniref:Uncharacterized protein n=1 Tax=Passalora fulva TaxID=5499 RepID=A0A9Q8LCQ8_PASFU|nr:uncharacterized protein CLAFUR5_08481 [Fulvia fulva]KAK4628946.1 hypothetical protein CLAFUR4_08381 [Fulvia fulva]KAK4630307.1 hypothetical protein CLAFUR0_08376 [Fulvia fulva]UJO14997.1 hypothetical protein CLAFUR5_08481 [Fulvia fulva]WPV12659.1 hypothetical protein CLAFUW4_08376 [Fulvia fulva]WPV27940.1 hypothetical protein CLAFUW7_08376 [Fulvia fulva]
MATNSTKNIFPFFDVPLELKDMIYDETLEDVDTYLEVGLRVEAKNVPPTNALLISKKFKEELETRAKKHSHLFIKDKWESAPVPKLENAILPEPATKIRRLAFETAANYTDYMEYPDQWFSRLTVQMDWLRSFDIKIIALICEDSQSEEDSEYGVDEWDRSLREQSWWELREFKGLQVLNAGYEHKEDWDTVLSADWRAPLAIEWKVVEESPKQKRMQVWSCITPTKAVDMSDWALDGWAVDGEE